MKICVICGKEFNPKSNRQKCCCKKCTIENNKECEKLYYEENKEKRKKYLEKNKEKRKVIHKKYREYNRKNLTDQYIKRLLINETTLKFEDIPQELIEMKRQHLMCLRKLNQGETK